jgi:hypothetical protein
METDRHQPDISTPDLVLKVLDEVRLLARKEIALAATESKAELHSQIRTVKGLSTAFVITFAGVNLIIASLLLGLCGWKIAAAVGAAIAITGGVMLWMSWRQRHTNPVPETKKILQEEARWLTRTFSRTH